MEIRPIRSDADHTKALRSMESLWGAEGGSPEGDALDVLATLVDAYEAKRWPEADVDPVTFLKMFMEDTGRGQADLAKLLGSRSRASEILGRKRALTVEMIWSISRDWGIPADYMVKPYALTKAA